MRVLLINYDNGSRWPVLPQNLYVLADALEAADIPCSVYDFNLLRPTAGYRAIRGLMACGYDVVGLGFISGYYPHTEALKIARVINEDPLRKQYRFIIGGHGPSAAPDYYLDKLGADTVFEGAADVSIVDWAKNPHAGIVESKGYDMELYPRAYNNPDVYKRVRFPLTKTGEFAMQILSGRGCPYACAFCYRMGEGFKRYRTEQITRLIEEAYNIRNIRHFQFSDELLMSSEKNVAEICEALIMVQEVIRERLYFDCNGRFNVAKKGTLKLMKRAGFRYINYGCEALDDKVLENINKKQTVAEIIAGTQATLAAGISPGLNFMWGNEGDSEKTLKKAVKFLTRYDPAHELRTIRPVTPYPGTPLFERLNISVDEFYDNHVNSDLFSYHFMKMPNESADQALYGANAELAMRYYTTRMKRSILGARAFYYHKSDPESFRGWRDV